MKFKITIGLFSKEKRLLKFIMKTFVFLCCSLMFAFTPKSGFSQDADISISKDKVMSIKQVFKLINKQADYKFIYRHDLIREIPELSLNKGVVKASTLLNKYLTPYGLSYSFTENNTVIVHKNQKDVIQLENIQQHTIKGLIIDMNNVPLPGANILEKGTTNGTQTDFDGKFLLTVANKDAVLVVSYLGFLTKEVTVNNQTSITINLVEDSAKLDEVVITALGIKRKTRALGYSVTTVSSEDVTESNENNVLNALQGKVAGLNISKSSGSANGSPRIVLRGNSSVSGNNQALIVVDGVVYDNTTYSSGGEFDRGQGISDINPDDIESVSVLKGPNAAALYGSKASNGVLIITTKSKIKDSGLGISVNSGITSIDTYIFPELQNVYGQGKAAVGAFDGFDPDGTPFLGGGTRDETWGPKYDGQPVRINWLRNRPLVPYSAQPNNISDLFRTGFVIDNSVAFSTGNEKGSFYGSVKHSSTDDVIPNSNTENTTASLRVTRNVNDKLNIDAKFSYTRAVSKNRISLGRGNLIDFIAGLPRSVRLEDISAAIYPKSDINYIGQQADGQPILWSTTPNIQSFFWENTQNSNDDDRQKFVGSVNLDYKFNDWLSLLLRYNINETNFNFKKVVALNQRGSESGGAFDDDTGNIVVSTTEFIASANKDFLDEKLNVSANFGGSQFRSRSRISQFKGSDFIVPGIETPNNTLSQRTDYTESDKVTNSLYAFAQIGYNDLIYLDLTARNDWSSTLSKENNSYFYPSITTSFVFSKLLNTENSILSFGKFRASWAEVGNDTDPFIINRSYTLDVGAQGDTFAANPNSLPFPELRPEETESFEFGLDLRFFKSRLNLDATYYKSNTRNQILPSQPLAISTGYTSKLVNAGDVENKGIELALTGIPVKTDNFTWESTLLFASNKSLVKNLGDLGDSPIILGRNGLGQVVAKAGQPFGTIQGRGLLRNTDGVIVVREDGRPLATAGLIDLGKVDPDWTGTIRNAFSYKGFNLGVQVDVSVGGNILAEVNPILDEQGVSIQSLIGREGWIASEAERAAQGNPSGFLPTGGVDIFVGNSVIRDSSLDNADGIQVGGVASEGANARYASPLKIWDDFLGRKGGAAEYNIEDASFVKLREVSLSYTLPKALMLKLPFESIKISAVGRNLWLIHRNTTHFDPDSYRQNNTTGAGGLAHSFWPSTRTIGMNLNIKF